MQHVTQPPDAQKNFLVVDAKTERAAIEAAFDRFTSERKDIAILLINQHVRDHDWIVRFFKLVLTLADC
jgi:V-type H+-transporting ATPase subunit F